MTGGLPRIPGSTLVRFRTPLRRVLPTRPHTGFTIVEVMIVLVVTAALFMSAALLISGKQNQAAFDQSIRQIQSQIQQAINEVAIGYYPNNANFQCKVVGGVLSISAGGNGQGTNSGCIFVGKVLQFHVHSAAPNNPEQFATLPLAGLQQSGGQEVTSLAMAQPTVVTYSIGNDSLQNGLTTCVGGGTCRMTFNDAVLGVQPIGAVAFVKSFAAYSGGDIVSGSQQVDMVPVGGSTLDMTEPGMTSVVNSNLGNGALSPIDPSGGVSICFVSGGTNQSGLITIGGNGRDLSVNLSIKENTTCS